MVQNAIDKLKSGKACGNDDLSAEHLIHSDRRITVLLSIFYYRVIYHGHLPDDFMKTIIIPLIQNKSGNTSNVNNYRPIALVTVASQLFEIILLEHHILIQPTISLDLRRDTLKFLFCTIKVTIARCIHAF